MASLVLEADGASLRVLEGTGGMQELGSGDKAGIERTIDDEILERAVVTFDRGRDSRASSGSGTSSSPGSQSSTGPSSRSQTEPSRYVTATDDART